MKKANGDYPNIYLYRRIVQSKLYIDANYAAPIDLEHIADEACFSKFHFIRLFKKIYGQTPHQYLIAVRIEKAKLFLSDNIPVSEVCFAVGFESLSSFSGLFRRLVGTPPSVYLSSQQEIKRQVLKTPLKFIPGCFANKNAWAQKRNFEEVA